jgi:hypothetical protein
MSQLFDRIELRGTPGEDRYNQLHAYMSSQNRHQTITGATRTVALPHATYQGIFVTEQPDLASIANALKAHIEANIWTRALILIIRSVDWAQTAG